MVGGKLAPHVPWQAMVYIAESMLDGGYAGGALISDRWVLTAGRNLFVRKSREDIQGQEPVIPKVYLGITKKDYAKSSNEVAVEKVRKGNCCRVKNYIILLYVCFSFVFLFCHFYTHHVFKVPQVYKIIKWISFSLKSKLSHERIAF